MRSAVSLDLEPVSDLDHYAHNIHYATKILIAVCFLLLEPSQCLGSLWKRTLS